MGCFLFLRFYCFEGVFLFLRGDMMKNWKFWWYLVFLLIGIGIVNIGEWIYFLFFNFIVLKEMGFVFVVFIFYLIRFVVVLMINGWVGSIIDWWNKWNMMMLFDFIWVVFIVVLLLMFIVWFLFFVYCIVFLI